MSAYSSGIAGQLEAFARFRAASGSWNVMSEESMRAFDRHCSQVDPGATELTQEMVDGWCEQRETENSRSCGRRTLLARAFVDYARARGLTEAQAPPPPKDCGPVRILHAFERDELARFFKACDAAVPYCGRPDCVYRKVKFAALFRLLYSSGIRTTEARLLRREDVDLEHGVLNIRESKGHDQHYVALHGTMVDVLRAYDVAAEKLRPGREWFFESSRGGPHCRQWLEEGFRQIWAEANGAGDVVAYDLRHNYAVENIFSWDCDAFDAGEKLELLSKSMGHRSISSTLYYYQIVPALADKVRRLTEAGFNAIAPEVWCDEEE